jgi:pimeloyl-ACP methyl ester carboxylesterase
MSTQLTARIPYKETELHLDVYETSKEVPTIVFVHGTGSYAAHYTLFLQMLADSGFNVIALDSIGHGRSGGERGVFTMADFIGNVSAAVSYALERYNDRIGAMGTSQGGEVVFVSAWEDERIKSVACHNILLAAKLSLNLKMRVLGQSALVGFLMRFLPDFKYPLERAFDWSKVFLNPATLEEKRRDPLTLWHYSFKSYRTVFTYKPRKPLSEMRTPILIVNGERDEIIPPEHCLKAFKLLPGPKELVIVPHAAHQLVVDYPETLLPIVSGWFKRTL